MGRRILMGVGNPYRRDDGLGPWVVGQLAPKLKKSWCTATFQGDGTELMSAWQGAEEVVVIDAVRAGATPGVLIELDAAKDSIPSDLFHYSSHSFALAEAVELSRTLGELPSRVRIYGLVGCDFSAGEGFSPEVQSRLDGFIGHLERNINNE